MLLVQLVSLHLQFVVVFPANTHVGATIIIVMIILALYTMRKRGLTIKDVIQHGKNQVRRGPPPPPKYGMDKKQPYDDEYTYARKNSVYPPLPAAINSRSGSLSTQTPLQALGRSDRYVNSPPRACQVESCFNVTLTTCLTTCFGMYLCLQRVINIT